MSDTFDDMFGSDDEQQTVQPTQTQQSPSTTTAPKATMDDLFGDDSETESPSQLPAQLSTQTKSELMRESDSLSSTPPQQLSHPKSLKAKPYGNGPMGQPDDIYVQELIKTDEVDKEVILLTVPRIVGACIDAYDPATFDRTKSFSSLPPYQREYTCGVESMIRFKVISNPDGTSKHVSNSRIIEWDNGEYHLQVGRQYFPLSIKQQKISAEKSQDFLMMYSNGLYYHVGSIISSWKTSIASNELENYRDRMTSVKQRLNELDKARLNVPEVKKQL